MAQAHHRHQGSLESVIDFSNTVASLSTTERSQATLTFNRIINYSSSHESPKVPGDAGRGYGQAKLIKLVYDHAISDAGRDNILRYFLTCLVTDLTELEEFPRVLSNLIDFDDWNESKKGSLVERVRNFADHLVDGFFIPLKASSKKTPQPTPALSPQSAVPPVGTIQRLSSLRTACLIRDRHRCVISRRFDANEAVNRYNTLGDDAKDNDGQLIKDEEEEPTNLEVAHIIPHSLASSNDASIPLVRLPLLVNHLWWRREAECSQNDAKVYTLRVLNMFDPGVIHQVEGVNIDRPYNALTLTHDLHQRFGDLTIYFEPVPNTATPHTYIIRPTTPYPFFRRPELPLTRTLFTTPDRNIDPPSSRLLAIHRACSLILHLSGAAEFVNKVIRDMDEKAVESDGTTALGSLISFGLRKWDGSVRVY